VAGRKVGGARVEQKSKGSQLGAMAGEKKRTIKIFGGGPMGGGKPIEGLCQKIGKGRGWTHPKKTQGGRGTQ